MAKGKEGIETCNPTLNTPRNWESSIGPIIYQKVRKLHIKEELIGNEVKCDGIFFDTNFWRDPNISFFTQIIKIDIIRYILTKIGSLYENRAENIGAEKALVPYKI